MHGIAVIFVYNDPTTKASVSHLPLYVSIPFSLDSMDTSTNATYPATVRKMALAVFEASSTSTAYELEDLEVLENLFRTPAYDLSHLVEFIKLSVRNCNARIAGPRSCLARLGYRAPLSTGPQVKTPDTAVAVRLFQPPKETHVAKKQRRRLHKLHHQTTPRSAWKGSASSALPEVIDLAAAEEDDSTMSANNLRYPPDEGRFIPETDRVTGKRPWSEAETNCVIKTLEENPKLSGHWAEIKAMHGQVLRNRTSAMIKDKVRNINRAAAKGK